DKVILRFVREGFAIGRAPLDLLSYAQPRTNTVDDSGIYNGLKQLGVIDRRPNNLNPERWASLSRRSGLFIEILQSMQCKVRADFADSFISHVQNRRIVIIEQFIPYAFIADVQLFEDFHRCNLGPSSVAIRYFERNTDTCFAVTKTMHAFRPAFSDDASAISFHQIGVQSFCTSDHFRICRHSISDTL